MNYLFARRNKKLHALLRDRRSELQNYYPSLQRILFKMYIVHRTTYTVLRTPYYVHRTMYTVLRTPYTLQYTMYSVHCTVYNVQCTMYNVHCTRYTVQGTRAFSIYANLKFITIMYMTVITVITITNAEYINLSAMDVISSVTCFYLNGNK